MYKNIIFNLFISSLFFGFDLIILNPSGFIAKQHAEFIIKAFFLLLIIIIPTIVLSLFFSFYYRNNKFDHLPNWNKSNMLEIIIWSIPCIIISILSILTWKKTHDLDPRNKISIIKKNKDIFKNIKPIIIQVISLDWKWLFIYPKQKIATINELVIPINMPIEFKITSSSNMNSFNIPALSGQIYAMPGMETKLNIISNKLGIFDGFSSNFSGTGFSNMKFKSYILTFENFIKWIKLVKLKKYYLDLNEYIMLEKPSINNKIIYYSNINNNLYNFILNRCINNKKKICLNYMK